MVRTLAEISNDPRYDLARAECLTHRSEFGYMTDDGDAMIRNATEALALLERAPLPTHQTLFDAQGALAYGYYLTRQNAKAEREFDRLLKEMDRVGRGRTLAAADLLNNWALVHFLGDIRKAEPLYRRSLDLHRSIEGEGELGAGILHNYAGVLHQLARYPEAESYYRQTLRVAEVRKDQRFVIDATLGLAGLLAETGRLDEATQTLATIDPYLRTKPFGTLRSAYLAYTRGVLARARRDAAGALDRFTEAVTLYDKSDAKFIYSVFALIGLAEAQPT